MICALVTPYADRHGRSCCERKSKQNGAFRLKKKKSFFRLSFHAVVGFRVMAGYLLDSIGSSLQALGLQHYILPVLPDNFFPPNNF